MALGESLSLRQILFRSFASEFCISSPPVSRNLRDASSPRAESNISWSSRYRFPGLEPRETWGTPFFHGADLLHSRSILGRRPGPPVDPESEWRRRHEACFHERMALTAMNVLRNKFWVVFCFLTCSLNATNSGTKAGDSFEGFLIDASTPYVYLAVDHVGPRKPLRDTEPGTGIWLRLRNNCAVPVVVVASSDPAEDAGEALWIQDEVVPNKPSSGTESMGAAIGYQSGQKELTDIFLWPNVSEAEVRGAEDAMKRQPRNMTRNESAKRPHGYNDGYQPGPQVLKVIPPGKEILFSVPINHVSSAWHFEIPFRLALPQKGRIRPPYSYLAFYQDDLERSTDKMATPTTH